MSLNVFRRNLVSILVFASGMLPGDRLGAGESAPQLAARAKEIFRGHCFECHGGLKTNAGVKILDRDLLVAKKKVTPGKPEESKLFELITAHDESVMPPTGQPSLAAEEIDVIRRWIGAGAPPYPADVSTQDAKKKDKVFEDKNVVGTDYVLKKILAHVRSLPVDDRRFWRYFSINHLITGGVTPEELDWQRDALAKALNHLSLAEDLVRPQAIDEPVNSVFAVDLRRLGWHEQPFDRTRQGQPAGRADLNFFDLVLLEYPYGILYQDSETYDHLVEEFLTPAAQVRPIVYVRADWFVSTATLAPLYHDLLQLPLGLKDLEARLKVHAHDDVTHSVAQRAGLAVSNVANNNRVLERHPSSAGAFWKSFDYRSSKGPENIFKDPLHLHPAGGEMIFSLPNHLQGYFVANGKGERLDFAVTDIVTDKWARDRTVRAGLSCMRCHDQGIKEFVDAMHPAVEGLPGSPGFDKRQVLRLYPEQARMDQDVKKDLERFTAALQGALGKPQVREPLTPVTQRFLDAPLPLSAAAAELGLRDVGSLQAVFRAPLFTALGLEPLTSEKGLVRRDMWEDYFDQVVQHLGLGVPVVPLDGLTRRDYQPNGTQSSRLQVDLATNKKDNVFRPGDRMVLSVTNQSDRPVYVELVYVGSRGEKKILTLDRPRLSPGGTCRYPSVGQAIEIGAQPGKEQIVLFASDRPFPPGELLRGNQEDRRGYHMTDRVVHRFYALKPPGARPGITFGMEKTMLKKTLDLETK